MTVRDFLDACQQRLAPGGQITARISLNHFCCGRSMCPHCDTEPTNCCRPNATTTASFLAIAHDMLAAGATLAVPWTTLGIDNWSGVCKGSPPVPQATVRALLLALRAQGWAHLAVNEVGKFCNSFRCSFFRVSSRALNHVTKSSYVLIYHTSPLRIIWLS